MPASKICRACGREFFKTHDRSKSSFETAVACSVECAARSRAKPEASDSFWALVTTEPNTGCWFWLGTVDRNGYGVFRYAGRTYRAHRFGWFLIHGRHPSADLLHRCDARGCVNPDHLREGTHAENMADMVAKRRQACGERHPMARLNDAEVRAIRNRVASGHSQRLVAEAFGINQSQVSRIVTGDRRRVS